MSVAGIQFACGDDTDVGADGGDNGGAVGVYVVNEGNFTRGNSSLSFYDADTEVLSHSVFQTANGRPLGDVANDILIRGDRVWIVVNNSHKIEMIETGTHRSLGTIDFPAGSGPYTIAAEDSTDIGYVPLLLSNRLARVNLAAMTVEDTIEVGANPTEVAIIGRKAYVTNGGFGTGTQVAVVDLDSFEISKILAVGDNPQAVVASGGRVVVLCGGFFDNFETPDADESTPGSLVFIDSNSDDVTDSIPLDSGASGRLELGPTGTAYFIVQGSIAAVDVATSALTPNFITPQQVGANSFYGLGVDPASGDVYVTDAKDFQSVGDVHVFDSAGTFVRTFAGDIIPRAFGFTE